MFPLAAEASPGSVGERGARPHPRPGLHGLVLRRQLRMGHLRAAHPFSYVVLAVWWVWRHRFSGLSIKKLLPWWETGPNPPPPARMVRRNTSAVWTPGIYGKALRYRARWLGGEFPRSKVVGGVPPPTTEAPTATQLPPLDVGMGVGLHPPPWWVPKTANEIFRRREVPENCLFPSLLVYYRLLFLYAWVFFHLKNVQERHELSIFWFVFFKR